MTLTVTKSTLHDRSVRTDRCTICLVFTFFSNQMSCPGISLWLWDGMHSETGGLQSVATYVVWGGACYWMSILSHMLTMTFMVDMWWCLADDERQGLCQICHQADMHFFHLIPIPIWINLIDYHVYHQANRRNTYIAKCVDRNTWIIFTTCNPIIHSFNITIGPKSSLASLAHISMSLPTILSYSKSWWMQWIECMISQHVQSCMFFMMCPAPGNLLFLDTKCSCGVVRGLVEC